jgi:DNA-3-methyladenine glycosylase II
MQSKIKKAKQALVKKDSSLRSLFKSVKTIELSLKHSESPYQSLVEAIAHQQLHGKAAQTILGRFKDLWPNKSFPEPKDILKMDEGRIKSCGFSGNKIKAIKDIAQKTVDGVVPTRSQIQELTNDQIVERLTQIYGVGKWTVEMMLIFNLGRLNVWPVDDFGIKRGFQIWKRKRKFPVAKDLKVVDANWQPYQTVVALHLWRLADQAKI